MTVPRLANPARTADVLRHLTTELRNAGHTTITLADLDDALNRLEANSWVLPKPQPVVKVQRVASFPEHRCDRPAWHPDDCNGACCWRQRNGNGNHP